MTTRTANPSAFVPGEAEASKSEAKSALRWSGLAGIAAGIGFLLVPIILFGFAPPVADPVRSVMRFPEIRTALAAGNFVNFLVNILWVALLLGLYQALRRTSPALALFGLVLGLLGLGVVFIESSTQVAFDPISSLAHAPGATAADQATLALVWQATQGMLNEFDTAAILLLPAGFIALGAAMLGAPAFGKAYGWLSVALGAGAIVTGFFFGTTSPVAAVFGIPIFIILPILWGWRLYKLSRAA